MKKVLLIISALMLLCSLWLLSKPSMSEIGIAYAKPAEPGQDAHGHLVWGDHAAHRRWRDPNINRRLLLPPELARYRA